MVASGIEIREFNLLELRDNFYLIMSKVSKPDNLCFALANISIFARHILHMFAFRRSSISRLVFDVQVKDDSNAFP